MLHSLTFPKVTHLVVLEYWNRKCENDEHENCIKLDHDSSFLAGIQIATVQGGVDQCGSIDYPSLYIRLDEPEIFRFIMANTNGKTFYCPIWQRGSSL